MTMACEGNSRPLTSLAIVKGTEELVRETEGSVAEYIIRSVDCLDSGKFSCVVNNNQYDDDATEAEELTAHCE